MKKETNKFDKYKYYRITYNHKTNENNSELASNLYSITQYYPKDYYKPVSKLDGPILEIISDESNIDGYYCVSLILMNFLEKELKKSIESKLKNLINIYGMNNIHFYEIFGRPNIIGNKIEGFLKEYIEIISVIPNMACLSISKNKTNILNEIGVKKSTNEEIYFNLFWNLIGRALYPFADGSIFHIRYELQDSLETRSINKIAKKSIDKFDSGLKFIFEKYPEKYISILKRVLTFEKQALLYSSLSDLIAYATNKIQRKINLEIPLKKIQKNNLLLLKTVKSIFKNYSGLSSKEIISMIDNIQL
ncbi:MAG: hypothetical protein E3J83_06360 [Candidatus Atribacteria bacterium]|nr:MAG: hypothetical protein E3J83_06360 [Candidatus Atribacteria bacterium]